MKHACEPTRTAGHQRRLTSWQYCRMPSLVPVQVLVPDGSDSHFPFCTFMCMFSLPQNMATWGSASRPALPSVGTWKDKLGSVIEIQSSGVEAGGRAVKRNTAWRYAKNSSILGNSQLRISMGYAFCELGFPSWLRWWRICLQYKRPGLRWWRICLQYKRPGLDPWVRKMP